MVFNFNIKKISKVQGWIKNKSNNDVNIWLTQKYCLSNFQGWKWWVKLKVNHIQQKIAYYDKFLLIMKNYNVIQAKFFVFRKKPPFFIIWSFLCCWILVDFEDWKPFWIKLMERLRGRCITIFVKIGKGNVNVTIHKHDYWRRLYFQSQNKMKPWGLTDAINPIHAGALHYV